MEPIYPGMLDERTKAILEAKPSSRKAVYNRTRPGASLFSSVFGTGEVMPTWMAGLLGSAGEGSLAAFAPMIGPAGAAGLLGAGTKELAITIPGALARTGTGVSGMLAKYAPMLAALGVGTVAGVGIGTALDTGNGGGYMYPGELSPGGPGSIIGGGGEPDVDVGDVAPGGNIIVKVWITRSRNKEGREVETQFGRALNGRIYYVSESGRAGSYRPYKSIVIGKTLTSRNVKRVAKRIKAHAKSLKTVLSVLK